MYNQTNIYLNMASLNRQTLDDGANICIIQIRWYIFKQKSVRS